MLARSFPIFSLATCCIAIHPLLFVGLFMSDEGGGVKALWLSLQPQRALVMIIAWS